MNSQEHECTSDATVENQEPVEYEVPIYRLPVVSNWDETNSNFSSIGDFFTVMSHNMNIHAQTTNDNFKKLAEETSENFSKLNTDIRSIISSQTMMFSICIILAFFVISCFKTVYEIFAPLFVW